MSRANLSRNASSSRRREPDFAASVTLNGFGAAFVRGFLTVVFAGGFRATITRPSTFSNTGQPSNDYPP